MMAGLLDRARHSRKSEGYELLNDAMIFLQALEQGQTVLTRNVKDFAQFLALAPSGRVLFYRI